jgi:hypothetical protein
MMQFIKSSWSETVRHELEYHGLGVTILGVFVTRKIQG